ncbi:MAG: MFS transporter [Minisyncoccia bacterium]
MFKKLIRQYYLLSFLFSAGGMQIISATYVTFLIHNGLNLFEVNFVNAIYFFTLFICEIPTGAFADIFGRKKSFVLACAVTSMSMFVYGFSHSFWGFALAEVLGAVGITFRNGAFQAWFVDSLKHHGYEGSYTPIFGRESLFNRIGGGGGAILGAYLAAVNPAYPWLLGGSMMVLVTIIALKVMNEEYFVRHSFSWKNGLDKMLEVAKTSIHYGATNKPVRFILIVTFIEIYAVQAINMYWQPFFKQGGVSTEHLGFLFSAMMLMIALGAFIVSRMKTEGRERQMILLSMMFVGMMIWMASLSPWLSGAIIAFLLHEGGRGFWNPMSDSYLQQRIPSHERATISSFCSTAPHIGGAIGLLISGGIAQLFGITASWMVGGAVLVVGAFLVRKNGYDST